MSTRMLRTFAAVVVFSIASAPGAEPGERLLLPDMKLYQGAELPREVLQKPLLVFAFLGTECPLAKLYAVRLQTLQDQYAPQGVQVVAVMSNRQDSRSDVEQFCRRESLSYPVVMDPGAKIADLFGAQRTPEVFVLSASRELVYRGRIDDQYGIGVARNRPTAQELDAAIQATLARKPVLVTRTNAVGCLIGRPPRPDLDAPITYSSHIAGILGRHCVACHREGEIAPFSLQDAEEVRGWSAMIGEVVREGRMPPWSAAPNVGEFANAPTLTDVEKQQIQQWVDQGAPLGDLSHVPAAPTFVEGWQLPRQPDLVVPVSATPFKVPALGEVKYQYFTADPKLTEDKWVSAAELLPGNRAVVHHILAFVVGPNEGRRLHAEKGFFTGYAPGVRIQPWPQGYAKRIPAGSQLVFQVHYTPIGSEQWDQSQLGLIYADPRSVTHEVHTSSAAQPRLRIPPHEPDYQTSAVTDEVFPPGSRLLALAPHMHLRGTSFQYELVGADGNSRALLNVPKYDFNWQHTYALREPIPLPAGAQIRCSATFDNSATNPHNPAPDQWVRWGDQTWDEMMIGYFHWSVPR